MTDERERRFRARINLNTGVAQVTEDHPVDRRTAATVPAQVRAPERTEPPRTVAPVTAPLFPWQRSQPTAPPPQETTQPMWQPAEVDPMQQVWSHDAETETVAAPQDNTLGWMPEPARAQQSASEVPWTGVDPSLEQPELDAQRFLLAQQSPSDTDTRGEEDRLVERLADRVMERLRVIYRLPPDEPPVLGAEHNAALDAVVLAYSEEQYHPAGAFASTPRPRVFHPAGAFANRDA